MDFEALVELLRNPPEDGPPATIYDDLSASYNSVFEGSQSRIAEFESQLAERDAIITDLKNQNYDLLMQVRTDAGADTIDEAPGNDIDSDPADGGVDSLFGDD